MKRPRLIAFCALSISMLMLSVAGSGFVFSQELEDAYKNFFQSYNDEFYQQTGDQMPLMIQNDYVQFINRIRVENIDTMQRNIGKYLEERKNALGRSLTMNENMEITQEGWWESEYDLHQQFAEKEKEMFPDAQERQQRQFQLHDGIMKRVESFGDPADIYSLIQIENNSTVRSLAQPDFLDLTPEQRDLIKQLQKEMNMKIFRIRIHSGREQQEKVNEVARLQTYSKTLADDEKDEIERKVQEIKVDIIKDYVPQLKAIFREGRESYMRVLTDVQKAKIKAVMDDMPDYMKNLFAAIDKQGGGLSILHNWQPGMGVPDYPNPNREAPRERTNTGGGRAFPGD